MIYIAAWKSNKVTSSGHTVYGVDLEDCGWDQTDTRKFPVANLDDLTAGDDTFGNVLDENPDFIILNADGKIDIDREALKQYWAEVRASRQHLDDDEDTYIYS